MMMSYGMFVFSLPTLAYQELARRTDWRHGATGRVGARPASQYIGPGADVLDLSGLLLPEVAGDPTALDTLREMGDLGDAWPLIDGTGRNHGAFVLDAVDERKEHFFEDGAARLTDFRISLHRVDDADAAEAAPPLVQTFDI